MDVNYSSARAKRLKVWKRNRDHTDGADAVRANALIYIPKPASLTPESYRGILHTTEYFAMAARTLQSFVGLIFRKDAIFDGQEFFPEAVSSGGHTHDEFARECVHEYMVTNDGGIFVDTPDTPEGTSIAEAQALELYPYLSLYPAESIRDIRYKAVRGRKRLTYVKLVEDEDSGRELFLIDGVYHARVWTKVDDAWTSVDIIPHVNNSPLNEIPFIPLSDTDTGATMDDLCDTNVTHFANSFALAQALKWVSAPVISVSGVKEDVELTLVPGAFWRFEEPDAKAEFVEYKGQSVASMERKLDSLEQHGSMIGSRMLIQEKSVSEAEGTVARRSAGENSILGSKSRHISERLTKGFRIQGEMMGLDKNKIRYTLNTNFVPATPDPALMKEWREMTTANLMPREAFFENMQKTDQIDESWDYEAYQAGLDIQGGTNPAGQID